MLKALVQLFAEKFLVSKKTWVSNQSQALVSGGTEIAFISSTDSQDYTAPCDGVVCLDTFGATWARLISITNLRGYLQEFIKCSRFLSQRVKRSTLISQRIKAPLISSSFRPLVLNEVKGGASC